MGWNIDRIILRDTKKFLGDRYAGCTYSIATSLSPVIIRYRGDQLTVKEEDYIVGLFPEQIRVEFQRTTKTFNETRIYGQGNLNSDILTILTPSDMDVKNVKKFCWEILEEFKNGEGLDIDHVPQESIQEEKPDEVS